MSIPEVYTSIDSMNEEPTPKKKSTSQHLKKTNIPCLQRHDVSGAYYGVKKVAGKIKTKSFETADRKTAERKLKDWINGFENPLVENLTSEKSSQTLEGIFQIFYTTKKGVKPATMKTYVSTEIRLKKFCSNLMKMKIVDIKPSNISAALSLMKPEYSARTYNKTTEILKSVLEIAENDNIISISPYQKIPKINKKVKVKNRPDEVPTIAECIEIENNIRNQEFSRHAEASSDLVSFLHRAALGQAEANNLKWSDVDFENNILKIVRQKTGEYFEVPIFEHLNPLMIELKKKASNNEYVFNIKSVKQCITNACKRLEYKSYSPRDLRKARIVSFIQAGILPKTIASWQGHVDNGVLIMKTYSNVLDSGKKAFEQSELAKLSK